MLNKLLQILRTILKITNWFIEKLTQPGRTSISDRKSYSQICLQAANNNAVFKNFKRNKDYQRVLEHVTQKQGQAYLRIIKKEGRGLLKYFNKFKENDKYGNPLLYKYDIGIYSPTTLRYIKVLVDLKNIFNNLNNLKIVEIGGGYGGQCKIISDVFKFKNYTLVDLKTVLHLARKYLKKLRVKNINYLRPQKITKQKSYDLIISNYAFSECSRKIQNPYIDQILKNSKRGYITYNYQDEKRNKYHPVNPYSKKEIIKILSQYHQIKILPERPRTGLTNFIIVWDDSKK